MFVDLDTTFAAFADVARPFLQETISKTPATLQTASDTLPRIRAVPGQLAQALRRPPAGYGRGRGLRRQIASALRVGMPVLRATPQLNDQLPPTAAALRRFNDNGDVREGIGRLIDLSESLGPPLEFIAPAQTVCNYATLLFRNAASAAEPGQQPRQLAARRRRRHADGAEQRGRARRRRRRTGAGRTSATSCTSTPTRTPRRRARTRRVRGRQRAVRDWPAGDRQRPRQPGDHDRGPDRVPAPKGGGG